MKYSDISICLTEIPDEICLGISVLGCPIHCPDCHSKHLWDINCKGMGKELTVERLHKILESNFGITCVLFLGGEWCLDLPILLSNISPTKYKRALYTGRSYEHMLYGYKDSLLSNLEYLKVGKYNKELGGLDNPNTNQRLYELYHRRYTFYEKKLSGMKDITYKFWRNKND